VRPVLILSSARARAPRGVDDRPLWWTNPSIHQMDTSGRVDHFAVEYGTAAGEDDGIVKARRSKWFLI